MQIEPGKEYDGQIIKNDEYDQRQQGKYLVHINDLISTLEDEEPNENHSIWCRNHVHKWRITPSKYGEYGQYFPLQPGTRVVVKFRNDDITSGYIERIRSDFLEKTDIEAQDCVTPKKNLKDRDEQYILVKTPKKNNVFYINEDTDNEPNTIYLIFNRNEEGRRTVYRINEEGIHIYSRDNLRLKLLKDKNVSIEGGKTEFIQDSYILEVQGNLNINVKGSANIKTSSSARISASSNAFITAGGQVRISGGRILLNSGGGSGGFGNMTAEEVEDLEVTEGATDSFNVSDRTDALRGFEVDDVPAPSF